MTPPMTTPPDAFAATLRQDGRATNEDAFLLRPGPPLVVALADGAGNAEQAARQALRLLERSLAAAGAEELGVFATWPDGSGRSTRRCGAGRRRR